MMEQLGITNVKVTMINEYIKAIKAVNSEAIFKEALG